MLVTGEALEVNEAAGFDLFQRWELRRRMFSPPPRFFIAFVRHVAFLPAYDLTPIISVAGLIDTTIGIKIYKAVLEPSRWFREFFRQNLTDQRITL